MARSGKTWQGFTMIEGKKYKIIYCDAPWKYKDALDLQGEGASLHYPVMELEEIKKLPIQDLADRDCILFFWATSPLLPEALEVIKAWGFEFKTVGFVWVKTNPNNAEHFKGIGRWVMGNAEYCLLATKGKPHRIRKDISQIVHARRRRHSEKPDEVRRRIVSLMGDVPRIELFARMRVEGWDNFGNDDNISERQPKLGDKWMEQ